MDDKVDNFADLGFYVGESSLRMIAHHQIREAPNCLLGGIGVNGREGSRVAGVEGIEQCTGFDSTYFSQNDPVRSPAKSGLQKIVERDLGLEGIRLGFDGKDIGLLDVKLGRILDDNDPLSFGNKVGQYSQQRCLPGPGSAADE